jgi:hypothetical protein
MIRNLEISEVREILCLLFDRYPASKAAAIQELNDCLQYPEYFIGASVAISRELPKNEVILEWAVLRGLVWCKHDAFAAKKANIS